MIPLKDTIPSDNYPVVNWLIILTNTAIFIYMIFSLNAAQTDAFIYKYGLIPNSINLSEVNNFREFGTGIIRPFFTNMFLHGSWGHIISNMWVLYIFGDNVEDRMGKVPYFLFYIICGLIAGITHFILNRHSGVPALGASGAISGVMAAYMVMFPRSKIISLVPVFIIPLLFPIPAIIFIGLWFLIQLLSGTSTILTGQAVGIAFWAHVGGFIGGLWLYRFFDSHHTRRLFH